MPLIRIGGRCGSPYADADIVPYHQAGESSTVDEHHALRTLDGEILGGGSEVGGRDENALLRARSHQRADEVPKLTNTNRASAGVFLGLEVDLVEAEFIFLDGAVDSSVARASGHAPHRGVTTAISHGDQEAHHHPFEEGRRRLSEAVQHLSLKGFG